MAVTVGALRVTRPNHYMLRSIQALFARQPMFTAHGIVKVHFLTKPLCTESA
jgi:hypothetical protein